MTKLQQIASFWRQGNPSQPIRLHISNRFAVVTSQGVICKKMAEKETRFARISDKNGPCEYKQVR